MSQSDVAGGRLRMPPSAVVPVRSSGSVTRGGTAEPPKGEAQGKSSKTPLKNFAGRTSRLEKCKTFAEPIFQPTRKLGTPSHVPPCTTKHLSTIPFAGPRTVARCSQTVRQDAALAPSFLVRARAAGPVGLSVTVPGPVAHAPSYQAPHTGRCATTMSHNDRQRRAQSGTRRCIGHRGPWGTKNFCSLTRGRPRASLE